MSGSEDVLAASPSVVTIEAIDDSPFGSFPGQQPPTYAWASAAPTVATVAAAPGQQPGSHPNQAILQAVKVGTTSVTVTFTAPSGARYTAMATVSVVPPALIADYDRNGVIDDKDAEKAAAKQPVYFWLNDDHDDDGDQVDDVPGQGAIRLAGKGADSADLVVNAIGDLLDFFPVRVKARALLGVFPKEDYDYRLMHADAAVNARETAFRPESTSRLDGPRAYLRAISVAQGYAGSRVHRVGTSGLLLSQDFLAGVKEGAEEKDGRGVMLLEAVKTSNEPLVLEIVRKRDGEIVHQAALPLGLDGVEQMFRHVNLVAKSILGDSDGETVTVPNRPSAPNWPDEETTRKWVVFVHGYNVDQREARGWHAEMFKRLYQSGSNAGFVGVTWNGTWLVNYHRDVINAFVTSKHLASQLSAVGVDGDITVMAHSLGNVVVSSAITQHGFHPTRYFMFNAAVPIEAFDGDQATDQQGVRMAENMRHPHWADYAERLLASSWWQLFTDAARDAAGKTGPSDTRQHLTWRNRFSSATSAAIYNFYSTGENVLRNGNGRLPFLEGSVEDLRDLARGDYAWTTQEMLKGVPNWPGTNNEALDSLMPDQHGGWGFNTHYDAEPYPGHQPYDPGRANALTDAELRVQPFFRPFIAKSEGLSARFPDYDGRALLADVGNSTAIEQAAKDGTQYKLLAEAIPALSFAVGANRVELFTQAAGEERNFNLQTPDLRNEDNNAWPPNRGNNRNWLHGDARAVAYPYVYRLFDTFVELGELK